jgi:ABC-2 type transport system ATP-binding protein
MYSIECINLSKVYENDLEALKNVNLKIKSGCFCVIAGPNGAGKTTLVRAIYGEVAPTKGDISIRIENDSYSPEDYKSKKYMGIMPQEIQLYEDLTVWEHVYYFALLKQIPKDQAAESSRQILIDLDLWSRKNTLIRDLSGGLKQLVCLAQALTGENKILILDESTTGLDVEKRQKVFALLEDYTKKGSTIVYTTHYLDEIEPWVDQIVILNDGKIIYDGNMEDIFSTIFYSMKIELPFSKEIEEKIKKPGFLNLSIEDDKIYVYMKKDEVNKIKRLFELLPENTLAEIKISRPTLEEGYLRLVEVKKL